MRDPFILNDRTGYFLYGTRGPTAWTEADGFDCYRSDDLIHWQGPIEIFHRPSGFWADRCYWAPECYAYRGSYFLLATFAGAEGQMGVQVLVGDAPTGPFVVHSDGVVTPPTWRCLDGTLYVDESGIPYLVFSRSFDQDPTGAMCVVRLSHDLKNSVGEAQRLFSATDASWARPFPFARTEFGIEGDVYLSDGPFVYRTQSGRLLLLWSSFGPAGYSVGIAHSATGGIWGPWVHETRPFLENNGGHAMVFRSRSGRLFLVMHSPNEKFRERPMLVELTEVNDQLQVKSGCWSSSE